MSLTLLITLGLGSGLLVLQYVLWLHAQHALATMAVGQQALTTHVAGLTQQLTLMGQTAVPIAVALQKILVQELTHFHTPELDQLLAKLGPPFTLTAEEEVQLLQGLKEREKDMGGEISESEREAAHILPAVINRVKRDQAATTPQTLLLFQTVSIVPAPTEEGSTPETPAALAPEEPTAP